MGRIKITVSSGAYLATAAGILMLPLNWLVAWLSAVILHELGHLLALRCCGICVEKIEIGTFGVKITAGPLAPAQEILCAAVGPICSFVLLLFWKSAPILALIGFVQGLFNLIPVYPLDGGRILYAFLRLFRE